MKVAIVLVTRWWRASIDQDGYCAELKRQGHSPLIVCRGNDAGDADFSVVEVTAEGAEDPAFWKEQAIDLAIVFNWLRSPALITAIRSAGTKVILRADSDGMASVRVFPQATWLATITAPDWWSRIRSIRHWGNRWLRLYREEDREILETIEAANAVAIESPEAAGNLRTLLAYHGRGDLGSRIGVVPHSVREPFLTTPFCGKDRPRRIFCGGRWDDPQKDAPLLAAVLERLLARESGVEVVIAGGGVHEAFGAFGQHPSVRLLGRIPPMEVPTILGETQFILLTSRWETQPIGTLEALCMGATVVAPPLPGVIGLADEGRSGTLADNRLPDAIADAASRELAQWAVGARDPHEIAPRWRARVSNHAVVSGLLSLVA